MKKVLTDRLGHWLDCLFGYYSDKIKIIANVLVHDWRMLPPMLYLSDFYFLKITEQEIRNNLAGLDEQSLECVLKYIRWHQTLVVSRENIGNFFYNHDKYFSLQDKKLRTGMQKILSKLGKKYVFPCIGPESLLFHHGLPFFPEAVIHYLQGGSFVDAGACYGDSTLIFSRFYNPGKIYAFEPSEKNREIMKEIMAGCNVPNECYEIIPFGVGEKQEQLLFCEQESPSFGIQKNGGGVSVEILSLDQYVKEHSVKKIRLIKADLEGMGLAMLKGAQQTIRENRPILTLSIYHNREELFEIYRTLRSWNLDYEFTIRSTAHPLVFEEIALLGYPAELNPAEEKWKPDETVFKNIFESAQVLLHN